MSDFGVILVRIRENVDQSNSEYGHFLENYGEYFFVFASVDSVKVKKLLNKTIWLSKRITIAITTSVLCNQSTLLICQLLLSTLILAFFKVGIQNPGKLLFSGESLQFTKSVSRRFFKYFCKEP